MTQEEILEYNRRCAEFLGITEGYFKSELDCAIPEYQWICTSANCNYEMHREDYPNKTVYDYLNFHSDWNWIMEIIEAIRNTTNPRPQEDTTHLTLKLNIQAHLGRVNKEAVFTAINQFLIWYNENKTN
jgi:hypothetical protein